MNSYQELIDSIDWNDSSAFKTNNYKEIVIESIAVLLGNYSNTRKQAAIILLKILLKDRLRSLLFEDKDIYPFDRNDSRVRTWAKSVISKGKCEQCGSTDNLEAHHILKWSDYPKGRIDIKNGMCLCHKCHTEEHKDDQSFAMMKAKCM